MSNYKKFAPRKPTGNGKICRCGHVDIWHASSWYLFFWEDYKRYCWHPDCSCPKFIELVGSIPNNISQRSLT